MTGTTTIEEPPRDIPQDPAVRFSEACLYRIGKAGMEGAVAGVLCGAALLSWYPDPYRYDMKGTKLDYNLGLRYVLRNMKGPVAYSALVCSVFTGVECVMEQMRDSTHESTYVNSAVAGAAAGVVMGSLSKRFDIMATSALGVGLLMGMVEFNGQTVASSTEHTNIKWHAQLVEPNQTTVNELKDKYPEFKHL